MRKRCPDCHATYEGDGVDRMYSCEACGHPSLTTLPEHDEDQPEQRMPRSGGRTVTHTRDNF